MTTKQNFCSLGQLSGALWRRRNAQISGEGTPAPACSRTTGGLPSAPERGRPLQHAPGALRGDDKRFDLAVKRRQLLPFWDELCSLFESTIARTRKMDASDQYIRNYSYYAVLNLANWRRDERERRQGRQGIALGSCETPSHLLRGCSRERPSLQRGS